MLKTLVRKTLERMGYEVNRRSTEVQPGYNSQYLSMFGAPNLVIDVGVGFGTPELYQACPSAKFVLIEPLREYEEAIKGICSKYNCIVYYKAVGCENGSLTINVDPSDLQKSSMFERAALTKTGSVLHRREVEVITLDSIFADLAPVKGPIWIKVDTEGNELSTLQGAIRLLDSTELVIVEASIAKRFEDSYVFDELVTFMYSQGFRVFDILTVTHTSGIAGARFSDVVFKRTN